MELLIILSFTLLQTIPLVGIFMYIFKDNFKTTPLQGMLLAIFLQAVFIFTARETVIVMDTARFSKFFAAVVSIAVQWLLVSLVTDLSRFQTLFVILVMFAITDDVTLSVQMIYKGKVQAAQVAQWSYVGWIALFVILYVPFFYMILKRELQPLINITRDYPIWKYMWLLPLFIFVVFRLRICPDYFNQGFVWYPSLRFLPYIWTLGSIGIIYFVLRSLRMTYERNRAERELEISELMAGALEKQYRAMQEQMEMDRRRRHDFRHTLLVLQQYAKEGNCDKIQEHIEQYVEEKPLHKVYLFCENTILNTVFNYFVDLAEKENIKIDVKACVPQEIELTETELSVLAGNLIENALEACLRQTEGERYIRIRFEKRERQMLSISVQNSYSGTIIKEKGHYISSKRNEFGIGMSSISYIVEQHNGVMRVQNSKGVFTVNILINC